MAKLKGIILMEPKHTCNLGSIARSMKSFGFNEIIIVKKRASINLKRAMQISKQGKDIIENIKIVESLEDITGKKIATISSFDNEKYGFELIKISEASFPDEFYIVMGREGTGLNKEEIEKCEFCVTIETNGKYGILNLGQATTIILYELFKKCIRC